jgi:hypothetical protein
MLSVIMQNVIMPSVIMPSVIMLNVIMPNVIMLNHLLNFFQIAFSDWINTNLAADKDVQHLLPLSPGIT